MSKSSSKRVKRFVLDRGQAIETSRDVSPCKTGGLLDGEMLHSTDPEAEVMTEPQCESGSDSGSGGVGLEECSSLF